MYFLNVLGLLEGTGIDEDSSDSSLEPRAELNASIFMPTPCRNARQQSKQQLTYLSWILGTNSIRSNNKSRETLWVLDTCRIVGLRPFIIILITASLSSKTYNKTLQPESVSFGGDRDCCAWLDFVFACWVECLPTSFSMALLHLWICLFGLARNEILQ